MVKPKQRRVEEAKEALSLAEDHLAKKQASLRKVGTVIDSFHKSVVLLL